MILRPPSRVVIVDDDPNILQIIRHFLEDAGYSILTATSANQGIALARQWTPELVLMDVRMPGMDGFEACSTLRCSKATAAIPVVFLTGIGEDNIRNLYEWCGASGYISKPFTRSQLLYVVDHTISQTSLNASA